MVFSFAQQAGFPGAISYEGLEAPFGASLFWLRAFALVHERPRQILVPAFDKRNASLALRVRDCRGDVLQQRGTELQQIDFIRVQTVLVLHAAA